MKNNLLKIIPFALLLALFFEILGYLKIDFPADISLFLASFNSICFSISIPLLVFCCLSKKSESLSNCGIFLMFLYVFLNILSWLLLKHVSNIKVIDFVSKISNVNRCVNYLISFFKYMGIFFLIDSDDEKANGARALTIVFIFLYELFNIIFVWKYFGIKSIFRTIRDLLYDLFKISGISFIIFKYFGDEYQSYSSLKVDDVSNNSNLSQKIVVRGNGINREISNLGNVQNQSMGVQNNLSQSNISPNNVQSSSLNNSQQSVAVQNISQQNNIDSSAQCINQSVNNSSVHASGQQSVVNSEIQNSNQSADLLFSSFVIDSNNQLQNDSSDSSNKV